jgi:ABC-type transporter Mla MlaB component
MHKLRVQVHEDRHASVHGEMIHEAIVSSPESLVEIAPTVTAIDLSDVSRVDAWGAYCLVEACRVNPLLRVVNPTDAARQSIEMAGVSDLLFR